MASVASVVLLVILAACGVDEEPAGPADWKPSAAAVWDPTFALPGPTLGIASQRQFARVNAMVRMPDGRIAIGGTFEQVGGLPALHVAAWDGTEWSNLGWGLPGPVLALAVDEAGTLWSAGEAGLARYENHNWFVVRARPVTALAMFTGGMAVLDASGAEVWDGEMWTLAPAYRIETLVSGGDRVCATGVLGDLTSPIGVGCWNGTEWVPLGDRAAVRALTVAPDRTWWAVVPLDDELGRVSLAKLVGAAWQPVGGPLFGGGAYPHPTVTKLAFTSDEVTLVGNYGIAEVEPYVAWQVATWNRRSQQWRPRLRGRFGGEFTPIYVAAAVADADRIHLGGTFTTLAGTNATRVATIAADDSIETWSGQLHANGVLGTVNLLTLDDHERLVALGLFDQYSIANLTRLVREDDVWRASRPWGSVVPTTHNSPTYGDEVDDRPTALAHLANGGLVLALPGHIIAFDGIGWITVAPTGADVISAMLPTPSGLYVATTADAGAIQFLANP